ncbi:hypothetical protein BC936DRAFT_139521 [Jimgerdemannia flammicorona]|uniref:Uncharacterized protein n=1 Tax=Jimgerdemannia flammicorona TaxID=994334 RepID=A0A433B9W7_9FUNG|nr:hypothetical protein BC936DRAFT_139521 [Jimgerdemannia flammicorona]
MFSRDQLCFSTHPCMSMWVTYVKRENVDIRTNSLQSVHYACCVRKYPFANELIFFEITFNPTMVALLDCILQQPDATSSSLTDVIDICAASQGLYDADLNITLTPKPTKMFLQSRAPKTAITEYRNKLMETSIVRRRQPFMHRARSTRPWEPAAEPIPMRMTLWP